ncbi:MAG: transporter substrate-binding domain-containing protein [Oleiphilaceae bacterium]|nr:transporter substrate-binding domain-containing protein [Oleiphilaceae bacterium]
MSSPQKSTLWLYLFTALLFCRPALSEEILVFYNESLPFCGTIDQQETGIAVEILKQITAHGGPEFRFRSVLWPEAQRLIHEVPNSALIPFTRTATREPNHAWIVKLFSHQPSVTTTQAQFAQAKLPSPLALHDIKYLKLGVIAGSAFIPELEQQGFSRFMEVKNALLNTNMLQRGRINGIIESEVVTRYFWKKAGLNPQELRVLVKLGEPQDIYLASGLHFSAETTQSIRSAMAIMFKNKAVERIIARWQ